MKSSTDTQEAGDLFRGPLQNELIYEIRRMAEKANKDVIAYRRHLHAYPELSFNEYETSAFVKSKLDELGISWEAVAETGVVALIKGNKPSDKVIALRADMDALPISEENQ